MKLFSMAVMAALVLLTFTLAHANSADAQDKEHYPIGQLIALQGKAFYVSGEAPKEMKLNDPVFMNTVVETGPGSRALILFIDNTQITLGENSEVVIDEFVFDPYDPSENKGKFEMTKGPFLWVSGLISKREEPQVDIKTKAGSIGIRGTKFWGGGVGGEKYGVFVFDGLVNFANENDDIDLPKNTGVVVGGDTPAFDNSSWPEEQIADAVETVTFSNQAEIDKNLEGLMQANIAKQHDYRGRMFPYKENPLEPRMKKKDDKFFSDEFEQKLDEKK